MDKTQEQISFQDRDHQNVLVLLEEAQSKFGCVPEEYITEVAQSLNISKSEVYGVATFYSFLSSKPLGRNVIRICKSLPCYLKNSQMIIKSMEDAIGIKPGETDPDAKFSLETGNCLGCCNLGPEIIVDGKHHGRLTPSKVKDVLKNYE